MKIIDDKYADNDLERAALEWLNETGQDYDNGAEGALDDLQQGGCQSGMVSSLIYYKDTLKFYNNHKTDINSLLSETLEETGLSVSDLFGDKWDDSDPLAIDTMNQNLLAWFGFEESAYRVHSHADYD